MASSLHDRGTRFTNYSSIHSADAFVGDYQVMYTPGNSPPTARRARKSTRFSANSNSVRAQNLTASYILPSNIPNTSQIIPDHGALPNAQIHYTIPADEKQIVASLRELQDNLADAMRKIKDISRERDEAIHELRLLRATSRKPSSPRKEPFQPRVEDELFDISRIEESPKKTPKRRGSMRKAATDPKPTQTASVSENARVLSPTPVEQALPQRKDKRVASRLSTHAQPARQQEVDEVTDDFSKSAALDDPTAASNTSRRRRRHSLDENMTSAYILPDITLAQPQPQVRPETQTAERRVSKEAQTVLHSHDPEHIDNCDVCHRLTTKHKQAISKPASKQTRPIVKQDYTAQITERIQDAVLEEPTMRPRIPPAQALENVRNMMMEQFEGAKRKHDEAWRKYDAIDAPLSSKKHGAVSSDMRYWAEKMEECRIHLDQLRDVEEGMME